MAGQAALLRILGIGFALAVAVGGMVGQGIMRTPGIVAGAMQDYWLILLIWLLGGILASFDAFAVAELAAAHPRSGGPYSFARRAFGPFAGVMTAWADTINGVLANAYIAILFGEYVHRLGLGTALPIGWLAALALLVCGGINWTGTRVSGASQTLGTLAKCGLLLLMVGLLFLAPRAAAPPPSALQFGTVGLAAMVVALRAATVTYSGWNLVAYFCEEVHDPQRNVVRALFGSLAMVTLLYLIINAALLHTMTPAEMAASNLPAADALQKNYGGLADVLTTTIALVSVFAVLNLGVMCYPRVLHALSRDGALPLSFAKVHHSGTPRRCLALTLIAALALAASGTYESLLAAAVVISQLVLVVLGLAAIRLRIAEPDLPRPFKMPLFPLPAVLGIVINLALVAAMIWESPRDSVIGLAMIGGIALAYGVIRPTRWQSEELAD